jgi:phosphoribosylaminoimidazole-succinocarboxamide synthase
MSAPESLFQSDLSSLTLRARGKVRDIYDVDERHMLIVTTDRISAFDCILPDPIPGKGRVLNSVSHFWFERFSSLVPNHLTDLQPADVLHPPDDPGLLDGRAIVVKKLKALPVEAVVRGYLIGSGWKDYQAEGAVCGLPLPPGLKQAEQLPAPLFTPSTKAELGEHDQNIDFAQTARLLGEALAERVRDVSLTLYREAATYALTRGIIIADTKFEFGLDESGTLHLIDEVLTPDSSRFWPRDQYQTGISPPSFDKQFVRDYLETLTWDKAPPAPSLPPEVIARTAQKYREAQARLTGD